MTIQVDLWQDVAAQQRREQFRMRRLQVFNWGTFSDLHDIRIAEDGFLFVGRSGSGKSTLLDAIAALLVPPQWLVFNAAAREGDRSRRDRNLASYVRGAWGDQMDSGSGEIATRYLRTASTWSALALTFANREGRSITLIQLHWLRGSATANADVRHHFMIAEREVDLTTEVADFDFDVRALKHRLVDFHHFNDTFRPYGERLRHLLGIDSEMALKLLHKTQSAKNLGDLNSFLREFMLDPPDTFAAAERLVAEFAVLDNAHQEVVTARLQTETLRPARTALEELAGIERRIAGYDQLLASIDGYCDRVRETLLGKEIGTLRSRDEALAAEETKRREHLGVLREELATLVSEHRARGGERIEELSRQLEEAAQQRHERLKRRGEAEAACRALGWSLADTARAFSDARGQARDLVESRPQERRAEEQRRDELRDEGKRLTSEFVELRREIEAMQRQPSNIPAPMLELRRELAEALRVHETELPFVGELLQVREDAVAWRGAAERVLHGFALSLLVEERRYAAFASLVNERHLGTRLVYYRVGEPRRVVVPAPGPHSLVHKLELRETTFRTWIAAELRERFDYTCVDSVQEFRRQQRALTREGQAKHSENRHEKDDRHRIEDRRRWVLGFDNREKLALFLQQGQELAPQIEGNRQQMAELEAAREAAEARCAAAIVLARLDWSDIDIGASLDRIQSLTQQLERLRSGDATLQSLGERIAAQEGLIEETSKALEKTGVERGMLSQRVTQLANELAEAVARRATSLQPDEPQRQQLDARFAAAAPVTLKRLDEARRSVERALQRELGEGKERRQTVIRAIEEAFATFKRLWPAEGADLDSTLAAAPDFMERLRRLEHDDLPRHEQRFFELLQEQSNENLAALNTRLLQARKDIHQRMVLVNEGLADAEFNEGTHLQIDTSDRHLPDVREFREQMQQLLGRAWDMDRASAEQRFLILRGIVGRLDDRNLEQRHWREQVLDVRLHVEFIGRETDANGEVVELYRSGAGKSGGQREKLATTCLAAALRYQLGGSDGGVPSYAAVVLDEAFGKADNEFTELAMRVFEKFGFQMIVATPLKSVMTLEPFIGGACFVDIADRRRSATLPIDYDTSQRRLLLPAETHGEDLATHAG